MTTHTEQFFGKEVAISTAIRLIQAGKKFTFAPVGPHGVLTFETDYEDSEFLIGALGAAHAELPKVHPIGDGYLHLRLRD